MENGFTIAFLRIVLFRTFAPEGLKNEGRGWLVDGLLLTTTSRFYYSR